MIKYFFIWLLLLTLIMCESAQKKIATKPIVFKKEGEVILLNRDKDSMASFDIELATTDYERQTGMMYRTEMQPNQGMLFVFEKAEPKSFYMKNTPLSLDILFVDEAKEIFQIVEKALPNSLENINSEAPAKYVLELLGGQVQSLQIERGFHIEIIQ